MLSAPEIEVLEIAAGRSNPEIAAELLVTAKTVRNHVSDVLGELGAATRAEAIAWTRRRTRPEVSVAVGQALTSPSDCVSARIHVAASPRGFNGCPLQSKAAAT